MCKRIRVWFWTFTLELSINLNLFIERCSKQCSIGVSCILELRLVSLFTWLCDLKQVTSPSEVFVFSSVIETINLQRVIIKI